MHPRRLYAHRGASVERPENTIEAFTRAVEIGVDALELDVRVTRDGHVIVVHDETAFRMAGVPTRWADLDLADAQRLDIGWGFVAPDGTRPFAGQGIHVPTFADVLDAFDVPLNVDLKEDARAIDPVIDLVRTRAAEDRVILASFQTRIAVAIRRKGYRGATVLSQTEVATLLSLPAVLWRQLPFTGSAAQVPVSQGPLHFDRAPFIAKCHSLGLRVDFWTIDSVDEAARLLALGADGIMTNDPATMRKLFAGTESDPT